MVRRNFQLRFLYLETRPVFLKYIEVHSKHQAQEGCISHSIPRASRQVTNKTVKILTTNGSFASLTLVASSVKTCKSQSGVRQVSNTRQRTYFLLSKYDLWPRTCTCDSQRRYICLLVYLNIYNVTLFWAT